MCAIAGFVNLNAQDNTVEHMRRTMQRRGPDGWGIHQDTLCTMLHSRLAIIDPEGGKQPMALKWAGDMFVLSYNGELYNTAELRNELEKNGHIFVGHSDTEVVLHAYAQWGAECLYKMNGIFAFAVWERKSEKLFLARDRIGVKPLFYSQIGNGLLFASEIKTLLCYPGLLPALDEEGAAQLLLLGPGRIPGSGVFKGISELEPGCCACFSGGHLSVSRYWKLTDRIHSDSFAETVERVRFLVTDAIKRQMVSDVPIGTFLSGGLDSSLISAVCAGVKNQNGEILDTFSVDYQNNDRYFQPGKFQPNSDNSYISKMLDAINSRQHWTVLTPEDLSESLEEATEARDLPGMADVDFSLLAFCKEIRKYVKVALSGECADEIFGGYPWYRDPAVRAQHGFPWAQTTEQRELLLAPNLRGQIDANTFVMDLYRKTCKESDILPENTPEEQRMKEMVNLNFRWFMQTLLDRKDRMSMYSGLEVRVPFCDYKIAEYLYGVPWQYKDYMGREKGLLRHAAEGLLPEEILYRKKSPYPKTFDPRYEELMENRLQGIMNDKNAPLFALVDKSQLHTVLNAKTQWPWYGQLMRRPQTMAYFVQLDFWLRHYSIQFDF